MVPARNVNTEGNPPAQASASSLGPYFSAAFSIMALVVALLLAFTQLRTASAVSSLTIETTSGPVTGLINGTTPNVAQFLGIPFAEQPVGERRWLPATLKSREDSIDATRFGHACPQFEGNTSNVWRKDAPEFLTPANTTGEDCLSVNVWAPWKQTQNSSELLPVIAWIYGGGFQTGAGNIPYQIPAPWVERSQKHIVVGIKYAYFSAQTLQPTKTDHPFQLPRKHLRFPKRRRPQRRRAKSRPFGPAPRSQMDQVQHCKLRR